MFVILSQRARRCRGNSLQQIGLRRCSKRWPTGQHFVQNCTQTEDIASAINTVFFAAGLLGTHVGRRANVFRTLDGVTVLQRQAKIGEPRLPIAINQNIARFHIAVNQTLFDGPLAMLRRSPLSALRHLNSSGCPA